MRPDTSEARRSADTGGQAGEAEVVVRPAVSLRGRTALVTGSTRSIGLGIAAALHAAGCRVVLNGRGAEDAAAAEHLARRRGGDGRAGYAAAALLAACGAGAGAPDILLPALRPRCGAVNSH